MGYLYNYPDNPLHKIVFPSNEDADFRDKSFMIVSMLNRRARQPPQKKKGCRGRRVMREGKVIILMRKCKTMKMMRRWLSNMISWGSFLKPLTRSQGDDGTRGGLRFLAVRQEPRIPTDHIYEVLFLEPPAVILLTTNITDGGKALWLLVSAWR